MLSNLGFGEILFLGLLLFLFFGPERLPQMAARLGRWVANLTRYSSEFLNEWREEARAVHDAMEQVRGIRDELAAARAEIAGALYEARDDLDEAVQGARQEVEQQVQQATRLLPEESPARARAEVRGEPQSVRPQVTEPKGLPMSPAARSEGAARSQDTAVSKTQEVVDRLRAKRASTSTAPQAARDEVRASPTSPVPERDVPAQTPPSVADLARLRDQVRDLKTEMDVLRATIVEVRGDLEARAPAAAGEGG